MPRGRRPKINITESVRELQKDELKKLEADEEEFYVVPETTKIEDYDLSLIMDVKRRCMVYDPTADFFFQYGRLGNLVFGKWESRAGKPQPTVEQLLAITKEDYVVDEFEQKITPDLLCKLLLAIDEQISLMEGEVPAQNIRELLKKYNLI